jgi:hypothetical protein
VEIIASSSRVEAFSIPLWQPKPYSFPNLFTMNLLPRELLLRFQQIGKQDCDNPLVLAKYFSPGGSYTFFATEFNPETKCFFGFVTGLAENEWGYTSLTEMLKVKCPPLGLPIERDLYFEEKQFSEIKMLPTYF